MDEQEAKSFLLGDIPPSTSTGTEFGAEPPPAIGLRRPQAASLEQEYIARNQAQGVPLDTQEGPSTWDRLMLDFRRNKENQIAYLESNYGKGVVRQDDLGQLIFRVPDPEDPSKQKDILAEPHNPKLSLDDFLSLSAFAPELAGSIALVKYAKNAPVLNKLKGLLGIGRDIGASTAGSFVGGAGKDVTADIVSRGTVDVPEILSERGKIAGMEAGLGAGTYSLARFFQYLKNPLHGSRGKVQFDALRAQKYFKDKYGIDVPLSIGESTGSPLAARTEVFIEKLPGGSPIKTAKDKQEAALRKLQGILMGTPSDEEMFGQAAIEALQKKGVAPAIAAEEIANVGLSDVAQKSILDQIATQVPGKEIYNSVLGKDLRGAIVAARDTVKSQSDKLYEAVKNAPGGQGKVFDGGGLQSSFRKILDSLPEAEQIVTKPTGLFTASGKPITTSTTVVEKMRPFVPENIMARLNEVVSLKNPKFSLSDLQQMRREVYDDIAKGEGVPGLGTHYLSEMGDALTQSIDQGVKALPKSDLKVALEAANKHYKEKVIPFNRRGLTELFVNVDEPGFVTDSEIASRLFSGEKAVNNWALAKETVGPASPIFTRIKRGVVDSLLEASKLPGEDTLDAGSLIKNLHNFTRKYREIADDVFTGIDLNQLVKDAKSLHYAQGAKIDQRQLASLLSSGTPTAKQLQVLIDAQAAKDKVYQNQILKAVGSGSIDEQTLRPADFVNRLLDKASASEVEQIVKILPPDLLDELRQKTFEKVFRDGARRATADDVNLIMSGERSHIVSGVKMADALKDKRYVSKLETILGKDGFENLDHYIRLQVAPEKEAAFAAAGGLSAGSQIANLERGGLFSYLGGAARNFLFSTILSREPLKTWLTRFPNEPGAVSLILSSPPFVRAVYKEFGEDKGEFYMESLRRSIQQAAMTKDQGPPSAQVPKTLYSPEEWKAYLRSNENPPSK